MNYFFTFKIIHLVGNDSQIKSVHCLNLKLTGRKQKLSGTCICHPWRFLLLSLWFHEYSERGLRTAKETGNRELQRAAFHNLSNAFQNLGDSNKAIKLYELALSIAKETGDRKSQGYAYINLGDAYQSVGDSKKAIKLCELGLNIVKETGNIIHEGMGYSNLSVYCCCAGSFLKPRSFVNPL